MAKKWPVSVDDQPLFCYCFTDLPLKFHWSAICLPTSALSNVIETCFTFWCSKSQNENEIVFISSNIEIWLKSVCLYEIHVCLKFERIFMPYLDSKKVKISLSLCQLVATPRSGVASSSLSFKSIRIHFNLMFHANSRFVIATIYLYSMSTNFHFLRYCSSTSDIMPLTSNCSWRFSYHSGELYR
jgi:hypothetical protein